MFCTNCGNKLSGDEKFCTQCGNEQGKVHSPKPIEIAPLSPEELNHKRNNSLGVILILSSVIGIGLAFWQYSLPEQSQGESPNILPYLIDLYLGYQVAKKNNSEKRQEELHKWILVRAILGALIWGIIAFASQSWYQLAFQITFTLYFLLLITGKLNEVKIKFSNYILIPMVLLFLLMTIYVPTGDYGKYINDIRTGFDEFSALHQKQGELYSRDTSTLGGEEVKQIYKELIEVSDNKQVKIDVLKVKIDEGLEKYKGTADEKSLKVMKELIGFHDTQNKKIIELSNLILSVDFNNITDEQRTKSDLLTKEIIELDTKIEQKGKELTE